MLIACVIGTPIATLVLLGLRSMGIGPGQVPIASVTDWLLLAAPPILVAGLISGIGSLFIFDRFGASRAPSRILIVVGGAIGFTVLILLPTARASPSAVVAVLTASLPLWILFVALDARRSPRPG